MKACIIPRTDVHVALNPDPAADPWPDVEAAEIGCFPWYKGGVKQATAVRACYDGECLHLLYECEDKHISAQCTQLNGPVYRDSCVEFFASPPEDPDHYFNVEVNCCGTMLLGYGSRMDGRRNGTEEIASRLGVAHSVPGPTKEESPADDGWVLQMRLPFEALSQLVGTPLTVAPGTQWRANCYRIGGLTDPQYGCWSPINWPRPNFHRPECFGLLQFGT